MSDADSDLKGDDLSSFYEAVVPHMEKMRRVAARLGGVDSRDDIVQDALLQAWSCRAQFDARKGSLSAWLLAITAHQATKIRRRLSTTFQLRAGPPPPDVESAIDVRGALRRLSPRERLAVDCYYFADLSVAETAAVMGCAEGTVKATLASARDRLRILLR